MNEREALLDALRDPAPPEIGWWPPAPGWWLLGALAVLVLIGPPLVSWWRRRRERRRAERRAGRWTRQARARIARLRGEAAAGRTRNVLSDASVLARQTLLVVRPRREIAALHGERWLNALDEVAGATTFSRGPGRLLESAPYRPDAAPARSELDALLDALEVLIERASASAATATAGAGEAASESTTANAAARTVRP